MTSEPTPTPRTIPLHDVTEPVVCTIDAGAIGDHLGRLERLRPALRSVTRTDTGVIVGFQDTAAIADEVKAFVATESSCCKFWGFETWTDDELVLRWDGPPVTAVFMDRLVGYLTGAEPIGSLFALIPAADGD